MGFNKIYKSLQELFPQIDSRVLRAVAIEHKDPDAAVEAVLEEIIPFFNERSRLSSPLAATSPAGTSAEVPARSDDEAVSQQCPVVHFSNWYPEVHAFRDDVVKSQQCPDVGDTSYLNSEVPACCDDGLESQNCPVSVHADAFCDASDDDHDPQSKTFDSVPEHIQESHIEVSADFPSHCEPVVLVRTLPIQVYEVSEAEATISVGKHTENYPVTSPGNVSDHDLENYQSTSIKQKNEDPANSTDDDFVVGTSESSDKDNNRPCIDQAETQSFHENIEASLSSDDTSMISTTREFIGADDSVTSSNVVGTSNGCTLDASLSRSSQMHIVDVIDVSIAASKDNKKILFSAMDSVINLMRELEKKEQAAELAKKEAAMGGAVAQSKTEELKKMLQHVKAANGMHAGEVYGEKAILITELRELQSRVLSLADEKDKSLAVLDEMRQSLQVRLVAAEDKIKEAERERLEKEKCALDELAKQQSIMEEVVQESNILRHQSAENAKLQDLLLDRGHVLDVMQGELAVIYQDVRLLKENFDANVPFSKSASSRQTSCKLASSSSSLQSTVSELETERCPENDPADLVDDMTDLVLDIPLEEHTALGLETHVDGFGSSTDQHIHGNRALNDAHKALLDDGWDVLDHEFESESA